MARYQKRKVGKMKIEVNNVDPLLKSTNEKLGEWIASVERLQRATAEDRKDAFDEAARAKREWRRASSRLTDRWRMAPVDGKKPLTWQSSSAKSSRHLADAVRA